MNMVSSHRGNLMAVYIVFFFFFSPLPTKSKCGDMAIWPHFENIHLVYQIYIYYLNWINSIGQRIQDLNIKDLRRRTYFIRYKTIYFL
jgi:hypothetical protein